MTMYKSDVPKGPGSHLADYFGVKPGVTPINVVKRFEELRLNAAISFALVRAMDAAGGPEIWANEAASRLLINSLASDIAVALGEAVAAAGGETKWAEGVVQRAGEMREREVGSAVSFPSIRPALSVKRQD